MWEILRDSTFGRTVRLLSRNKTFQYHEDSPDFDFSKYLIRPDTNKEEAHNGNNNSTQSRKEDIEATRTINHSPIIPLFDRGQTITIIGWYGDNDTENPQNWSNLKRYFVGLLTCLYTFSVYVGSAIYVPSESGIMEEFGVSQTVASLGLALYVVAYGLGPMLFSPLSEIPVVGRTTPYIITFAIFVILLIPTALVENFAGLLILRFLLGFFGSPCLATAGASFQDIFPSTKLPYIIAIWAAVASCGPAFGPILSSFSVLAKDWRWSQWELLWLAGLVLILMFIALPETSTATILLRRARRLRKSRGIDNVMSRSEIVQKDISAKEVVFNALIKPWEINILDPAVLFSTFFSGLVYGIFYTYFESFPLVYEKIYDFNPGNLSLTFLAVSIALLICVPTYMLVFRYMYEKKESKKNGTTGAPEDYLRIGLWPCFVLPIGLFIFAFTERQGIHWVVSLIGVALSTSGVFVTMQCLFLYVPSCYPSYAASLLAANALARSILAAAAILFAPPMFKRLGIEGGVGLLAGLTVLCCGGLWFLRFWGAGLRARSRFAVK